MSSPPDPARLGRELATRHGAEPVEVDETLTLLQVAESPRIDDWTLRSALVRFAQPQPELSGAILESVRRTQAALDPVARELLRHGAVTDRGLAVAGDGGLAAPSDPLPDVRVADLARLVRLLPGRRDAVLAAYTAEIELEPAERDAVALLVVLLDLDELADGLTAWASTVAPADPPVEEARRLGRMAFDRLAALGVARETRERPPGRRPTARNRG